MIIGNDLYKLNNNTINRLTADDIPEGEFNKYCLSYADGKVIGDIILRPTSEEIKCLKLLNGQIVHKYTNKDFYDFCLKSRETQEFFTKSLEEYETFLSEHVFEGQHYCPYFVITSEARTVYQVINETQIGYTPIPGEIDLEVESGYIYTDENLDEVLDNECIDWFYTGVTNTINDEYVKLPTCPTFLNGNSQLYYFIVVNSRVDDDTTSIRSVKVGNTITLDSHEQAYVRNVGSMQNLILDFGIPSGFSATMEVGTVTEGDAVEITNTGTAENAIFNFTLPRGPQGIAGGVINLTGIEEILPETGVINDKIYNKTDNKIYLYTMNGWEEFATADAGLIYTWNNLVYYFNESTGTLEKTYSNPQIDNLTINETDGKLQTVGQRNIQGEVTYNWVGTRSEWEEGRNNNTIPDSYLCYIVDDNTETEGSGGTIIGDYVPKTSIVTTVNENSTDTQVPSAKLLYNIIGNLETILGEI